METKQFAIVGTDARQAAAGRALERAGCAVSGAEQVARADCILLPLPLDESRTRWQSCCVPQSPARWRWAEGSRRRHRPLRRKRAWSWWITTRGRS